MKNRISKITDTLGFWKRRLAINANSKQTTSTQFDILLTRARDMALRSPGTPTSEVLLELCAVIDSMRTNQVELRREAFREAVRGIANVIRNQQLPGDFPLAKMIPGGYGSPEKLAEEIERANAQGPVDINDLRQLRQKLRTATEGSDEIDEAVKRVYYAKVFETNPSTEDILPPGSPSRSLELAAHVVQKVVPNGWWTMGSNGVNLTEPPVAKVGTWAGDNPKAESAATTPLALLSALVLTLIAAAKKDG